MSTRDLAHRRWRQTRKENPADWKYTRVWRSHVFVNTSACTFACALRQTYPNTFPMPHYTAREFRRNWVIATRLSYCRCNVFPRISMVVARTECTSRRCNFCVWSFRVNCKSVWVLLLLFQRHRLRRVCENESRVGVWCLNTIRDEWQVVWIRLAVGIRMHIDHGNLSRDRKWGANVTQCKRTRQSLHVNSTPMLSGAPHNRTLRKMTWILIKFYYNCQSLCGARMMRPW